MANSSTEKTYRIWTWILSIVVPIVVAILFGVRIPNVEPLNFLPPIYATTNGITALVLLLSLYQIRKGNRFLHEVLMKTAIVLSLIFLVMYVAYHMTSDPTPYGGIGFSRYVYYFILISHILLSITVIPFVLVTYTRAILGKFPEHKRIAKITFPIWLYVAVTGVIVYLMIAPYYA
jgi:putative membrane protein